MKELQDAEHITHNTLNTEASKSNTHVHEQSNILSLRLLISPVCIKLEKLSKTMWTSDKLLELFT